MLRTENDLDLKSGIKSEICCTSKVYDLFLPSPLWNLTQCLLKGKRFVKIKAFENRLISNKRRLY